MRHIVKTTAPQSLERWKAANKGKGYYDFGKDAPQIKSELRLQLIEEQKYICCYCERCVKIDNNHIEHFVSQDENNSKDLDYFNLMISCNDNTTCGHKKGNTPSSNLVSPMDSNSTSHFTFYVDGSISGNDESGIFTIDTLNINCELLKQQRKVLIDGIVSCLNGGFSAAAEEHLCENDGKLSKFYSTIEYLHNSGMI